MKHLISKKISISNLEIIESKTIFKIKIIGNPVNIFGIALSLNKVTIINAGDSYHLVLSDEDSKNVKLYDRYLSSKVNNYKDLVQTNEMNENIIIISPNKTIIDYFHKNRTSMFINIKYVKKNGFLNNPIVNII